MDNPTAVPPPPPPPPPQPSQPAADHPTQAPGDAQPPAEQPATPQPGTEAGDVAQQDAEPLPTEQPAQQTQPPAETADDDGPDLPLMPAIESIPETVRIVMLAGGIPEAIFARDLKIPFEHREELIRKVAKALTGMDIPAGDSQVTNVAANCTTVKELIEFFELSHPDHPTSTGAGS